MSKFVAKFRKNDYSNDYEQAMQFMQNKRKKNKLREAKKVKYHEHEEAYGYEKPRKRV